MKKDISFASAKKLVDQFDGWLSPREEKFLYRAAKHAPKGGSIVEIGSWQGKSTTCLAYGTMAGHQVNVYAIDPHEGSIEQKDQLAKLENKSSLSKFKQNVKKARIDKTVIPIIKKSEDAAKEWKMPISFLWIDGDHRYEVAKSDFDLYSPFVIEKGIIAFHDSTQNNVPRVVYESFKKKGFRNICLVDSIAYAQKISSKHKRVKDYFILFLIKNYSKML